ncbi:ABC transporter permease [Paenarthrobacter nicotinovorans]|uniref:ABC transporter permease n=1 Tax=Paenarthrobacter nicotinovorans TaxID=29320 RepID=UPI003A80040C
MGFFIFKRVLQAILVLWLAFTVTFVLLFIIPGDAALARMGTEASLTPAQIDELRTSMGLNRPLYVQYCDALFGVVQGDLGTSLRTGRPVVEMLGAAIPHTLTIAALALVVSVVAGFGVAVAAVYTRMYWLRSLLLALPAVGVSIPTFWVGLMLLSVFAFGLGWFPSFGSSSGPAALVLPVITLAVVPSSMIAQVLAGSLESARTAPYAYTAYAKGASRLRVIVVHCLRNASISTLTLTGLLTGGLLTGAVVTESVFSRAGLGRVILEGVQTVDLTVVQGVVLVGAVVFVAVNLLVDLAYPLIDPRIRRSKSIG